MRALLFVFIFSIQTCYAIEGVYTIIVQKQQEKAQTRWTLADWLMTKKKMALMDQWLALHSSHQIFELDLGWSEGGVKVSRSDEGTQEEYFGRQFYSHLFIYFIGFGYESSFIKKQMREDSALVLLRILGTSKQTTHINLVYGKRNLNVTTYGKFEQEFFGGNGALYILPFLGVKLGFYKYLTSSTRPQNFSLTGERFSYSPFLELGPIRFNLEVFKENLYFNATASGLQDNKQVHEGAQLGTSLSF